METDVIEADVALERRPGVSAPGFSAISSMWSRYSKTLCEAPSACSKMLWMPTRRFTGSSSITRAMTKLAKSPGSERVVLDLARGRNHSRPTMVTAPTISMSGEESACCRT